MIPIIVTIFVLGYACIALEHKLNVNKAATALVMFGLIWTIYALHSGDVTSSLIEHLGSTCETLVFLIGAMTIVEIIDSYGGFNVITKYVTTNNKFKLLWIVAIMTFFISAVLDNMTTTIIMIMMLRKIIDEPKERMFFASIVVIAANSGGAWSPIGDVTTIMLWMRGNASAMGLMSYLIVPSLVSLLIPVFLISRKFKNSTSLVMSSVEKNNSVVGVSSRLSAMILVVGVLCLVSVPIFKSLTGLPPYLGVMFSLGILWVFTEIVCDYKKNFYEESKFRVVQILRRIDMATILFFLGILMSVAGLQSMGVLKSVANFLDTNVHEVFSITTVIGMLSSVIDNVPLVAACMGMYPIVDVAELATAVDPQYLQFFTVDGLFWILLAYCTGIGGSLLIIGSAAGVVAMGLEKLDFMWYMKNVTLNAFLGYLAGVMVIFVESLIFM